MRDAASEQRRLARRADAKRFCDAYEQTRAQAQLPSPASVPTPRPVTSLQAPPSAAAIASAVATGVAAERDRIRGILEAPEARGREKSAAAMAYGGGFTVDQARIVLFTLQKDDDVEIELAVKQILQYGRGPH